MQSPALVLTNNSADREIKMKTMIAALALMFVISANAGMASAHEDEHEGYSQHETKDHGDKDRHEHGDKDKDRSGYQADREAGRDAHRSGDSRYGSVNQRAASEGSTADSTSDFLRNLWPF